MAGDGFWAGMAAMAEHCYAATIAFLTTSLAQRVEAGLVMLAVLVGCILLSRSEIKGLQDLNPDFLTRRFNGPRPQKARTIRRRIEALKAYRKNAILETLWSLGRLAGLAILIPAALFAVFATRYAWFFPGQHIFADTDAPSALALGFFIADQLVRAPTDAAELFGFQISSVAVVPHAYLVDSALLFFRTYAGGALYTIAYSIYLLARAAFTPDQDVDYWVNRLEDMHGTKPS